MPYHYKNCLAETEGYIVFSVEGKPKQTLKNVVMF